MIDQCHCPGLVHELPLNQFMAVLFTVVFLLVVIGTILFVPIILRIDTRNQQYYLQLKGIVMCSVMWKDGIRIRVKLPFYSFEIDPIKSWPKKKKKKRKRSRSSAVPVSRILSVLRSFDVKEFRLDLDTSDVIWNAYLFPVFFFLNSRGIQSRINYNGQNQLVIHIENRLSNMAWAFLKDEDFMINTKNDQSWKCTLMSYLKK